LCGVRSQRAKAESTNQKQKAKSRKQKSASPFGFGSVDHDREDCDEFRELALERLGLAGLNSSFIAKQFGPQC